MSLKGFKDFLFFVNSTPDVKARCKGQKLEDLLELGKSSGFIFSIDDIKAYEEEQIRIEKMYSN